MKVLVFSTNGLRRDGITSWMKSYFSSMDRAGLELHTLAFRGVDPKLSEDFRDIGFRVHLVPHRKRKLFSYVAALRRVIQNESIDIVHVNGNSGTIAIDLFAALGTGVRVRIAHSRNTLSGLGVSEKLFRPLMNRLITDRLACGQEAGRWLFGEAQFDVIPNGKDLDEYSFNAIARSARRQEFGFSDGEIVVGHVGNFNRQKNHRFLVHSFARAYSKNPLLRLVLVGDGPLCPEIRAWVASFGLSDVVTFAGVRSDVPELLNSFDLAVLPSFHEGLPNVVIEWQANGLPAIVSSEVTEECAATELVEFLPIDDEELWAATMAAATASDRAQSSVKSRQGLTDAGFDVRDGAAKLRAIYRRAGERVA